MPNQDGKYFFGTVKVGEKGQIVLPKEARTVFGINAGDSLVILGDIKQGIGLVKLSDMGSLLDEIIKSQMGDVK